MEGIMRRIFVVILVFVSFFTFMSCGGRKGELSKIEEVVTKTVSAENGGTVKNSDESVSIEIPAGALESDTQITMKIYESANYPGTEDKTVISKVVEFEPSGTIFKKPVVISMVSLGGGGEVLKAVKKQVVTAAVYREDKGAWSYSPKGAAVKIAGHDDGGDPIMQSALGDPIMLNDDGDPIMIDAMGDPIMLSAAGDPIMVTALGDPIMGAALGDPIMMTTGHFTAYAFFLIDVEEEEPAGPDGDDSDDSDADADSNDDSDSDEDGPADVPECGNGIVEEGEECDDGADNGRFFCDYGEESCELCSLSCKLDAGITSYCGDGSIDSLEGETCDDGADNGKYAHCNEECSGPARYCGDGHVDEDEGEICDDGADNDTYGHCNAWCDGFASYCGDGVKQDNEECDLGENNGTTACASDGSECLLCSTECRFKCKENYTLEGSQCVADTQTAACTGLPSSNAQWNTVSSITQTWSGTAWLPSATAVYSEESSTEECRFKCADGFFWNGSACVSPCESDPCSEASANALSGSCTPVSMTEFICGCSEGYAWGGDKCLPECGPGSDVFPCIDSANRLIWSSRTTTNKNWSAAVSYCEDDLNEGGYSDWRLPTIDELRTLVVNCPGTQADGACAISDPDRLSETDRVIEDCSCEEVSGNSTYYSKFGNDTQLWSSSDFAESDGYAWRIYFNTANVNVNVKNSNSYPVRCVR